MNPCKSCGVIKPESEFYAKGRGGALFAECKSCHLARCRAYRAANIEAVRAHDRVRDQQPHRREKNKRVMKAWLEKQPRGPANEHRMNRWRGRTANLVIRAHNEAVKQHPHPPKQCQMCGLTKRLERHHPNYDLPLLIVWLCKPCHAIADRARRADESRRA
jgi:hypothetical protein